MAHHQLDELDEKILKLIIGNARMPFLEKLGMKLAHIWGYS